MASLEEGGRREFDESLFNNNPLRKLLLDKVAEQAKENEVHDEPAKSDTAEEATLPKVVVAEPVEVVQHREVKYKLITNPCRISNDVTPEQAKVIIGAVLSVFEEIQDLDLLKNYDKAVVGWSIESAFGKSRIQSENGFAYRLTDDLKSYSTPERIEKAGKIRPLLSKLKEANHEHAAEFEMLVDGVDNMPRLQAISIPLSRLGCLDRIDVLRDQDGKLSIKVDWKLTNKMPKDEEMSGERADESDTHVQDRNACPAGPLIEKFVKRGVKAVCMGLDLGEHGRIAGIMDEKYWQDKDVEMPADIARPDDVDQLVNRLGKLPDGTEVQVWKPEDMDIEYVTAKKQALAA